MVRVRSYAQIGDQRQVFLAETGDTLEGTLFNAAILSQNMKEVDLFVIELNGHVIMFESNVTANELFEHYNSIEMKEIEPSVILRSASSPKSREDTLRELALQTVYIDMALSTNDRAFFLEANQKREELQAALQKS